MRGRSIPALRAGRQASPNAALQANAQPANKDRGKSSTPPKK